jgi:hypothetical protein
MVVKSRGRGALATWFHPNVRFTPLIPDQITNIL